MKQLLIVVAVLALVAGAAHGEGLAVGLHLPKDGLSLWKVGEFWAAGLKVDARWTNDEGDELLCVEGMDGVHVRTDKDIRSVPG